MDLRLLICFLLCCTGTVVSGQQSAAQGIDFTVPEPRQPDYVWRLELLPTEGGFLTPKQEREALRLVAERCCLLAPNRVAPRLVRNEGQVFLHLYSPLKLRPGEDAAVLLQHFLNRRSQTCFLAVHPRQEELLEREDVINLISRYELEMTAWMESPRTTPPPRLPHLPDTGDTAGYMLAEYPGMDEQGNICYAYLIVRAPEVARNEGLLVGNGGVDEVEIVPVGEVRGMGEGVRIRLLPEDTARLHRLTLPLARAQGQIALVSDGSVLAVAAVTEPLSREFILTGADTQDMLFSLLPPLPCEVRLHSVRE